jgi:uncharacterized protein
MSEQAVIDNLDFARNGRVMHGVAPLAGFSRLQDSLLSSQGVLNYTLSGKTGAKGEPLLICSIEGQLVLQCQRCLEAMEYPLHIESQLRLVQGATQFDDFGDDDEEVDSIPVSAEMDVLALVEDEILLSLPISPLHPPEHCLGKDEEVSVNEKRNNPFGVLAALKVK